MGFLDSFFGKKAEATPEAARELLRAAEEENLSSPERAMKQLRRAKAHYALLCIGGELHAELRRVYEAVLNREGKLLPPASESVDAVAWDSWDYPTVGKVADRSAAGQGDFLLLRDAGPRGHHDAVAELEALAMMRDEKAGMIQIGEGDLLLRKAFLKEILPLLDAEDEEIGQAMLDAARKTDWQVGTLIV